MCTAVQRNLLALMHRCLCVDEIVRVVAHELVVAKRNATAVALACCCKRFEDPVLDALWETQSLFIPLLKTLPGGIWSPGGFKSFERLPTAQEWARLRKYAQRMRSIRVFDILDLLSSQVLSVLQFRALGHPLFPNLKTLDWHFTPVTGEFIPFIPLFLSARTTTIDFTFSGLDLHKATTASMIAAIPALCPNLRYVRLKGLARDSMIAAAVSELVTNTRQNTLEHFCVDSPLTEEACEVIYKHPDLCQLETVIDTPTALPTLALPNLTDIDIKYYHGHDWLQGFCGASLGKLAWVTISSESDSIGDVLAAFKSVALTTSIPATLSTFSFATERPWRPSYRSLLPFTQLKNLTIESSCKLGCSSTIDDDTVTDLARAMPQLEILELGDDPCETPTGITVNGLAALAHYCPHLSELRIHFQVASLDPPELPGLASTGGSTTSREDCALCSLCVGQIRVPAESMLTVTLTLHHIFPHLEYIEHFDSNMEWDKVLEGLDTSKELARRSRAMLESAIGNEAGAL